MKLSLLAIAFATLPSLAQAQLIPDRATLNAILGGGQTLEDFEAFNVAATQAMGIGVIILDDSTLAAGQGPGLVAPGVSYECANNQLQWNGDMYFGMGTKTFLAFASAGGQLDFRYTAPVTAMGVDVTNFEGFGFTGQATIRDVAGAVVGTVPFTLNGGPNERVFVGWQHAGGIGRVEIQSPDFPWSPVVDDHGYGGGVGLGTNYCGPAAPNSTGSPATITASGSNSAAANDLTLTAGSLPANSFGYFLNSQTQDHVVNAGGSQGTLCLGGTVGRHNVSVLNSGAVGTYALALNLTALPQPTATVAVMAGETWNFQSWYRDANPGVTSNFTDAVSVTFQ